MKNWNDFRYVLALVRTKTYSAAAQNLGVTAVTVSRRIARLEEEYRGDLFTLANGEWLATDLGMKLADTALQIEEKASRSGADMLAHSGEAEGRICINSLSFINQFFLSSNLRSLINKHPKLLPVLEASERNVSLAYGEADIALRFSRPNEGNLIRSLLAIVPFGCFVPDGGDKTMWVALPESHDDIVEMRAGRNYFSCDPVIRTDSYYAAAVAAKEVGVSAVLPSCIAQKVPGLKPFNIQKTMLHRQLWCVYHASKKDSVNLAAALAWLGDVFGPSNSCLCGLCGAYMSNDAGEV